MKIIDVETIITRAVKANDPDILKESGKSFHEMCKDMPDIVGGCLGSQIVIGTLGCRGLGCSDDHCPFYNGYGDISIITAKAWIMSNDSSFSKHNIFIETESISLKDLLSQIE